MFPPLVNPPMYILIQCIMRGGGVHDGRAPVTLDVDLNYHNAYLYVHRCRRALNRSLKDRISRPRLNEGPPQRKRGS